LNKKVRFLLGSKLFLLLELRDVRILELDYSLLQDLGVYLSEFVGTRGTILRLYWKSKEKHKLLLLRGEE
jgi:hypothetical protein